MKVVYTDVLVIGGGLAGLRVAIGARRRGHDAIVLSLVPPKRSHSAAAQGGMQASLGNVIKGQGDNEDVHFEDTVRGSDWGADQDVVRMFVDTAPPVPAGPVIELHRSGPPERKLDLLVLGDGYTAAECKKFEAQARQLTDALLAVEPFRSRRGDLNVWALCPPARESGVSRPSTGIHRNSPVGATYDAFGSERYVLALDNRRFREVASQAPYSRSVVSTSSPGFKALLPNLGLVRALSATRFALEPLFTNSDFLAPT